MLSASAMDAVIRPPDPHRPLGNIIGELMCSMWVIGKFKIRLRPWLNEGRQIAGLADTCGSKWIEVDVWLNDFD